MLSVKFSLGLVSLLTLVMLSFVPISLAQTSQPLNDTKGKLLYEDNFSASKTSIFSSKFTDNYHAYFNNGKYRMELPFPCPVFANYHAGEENTSNIIMEVEATQVSGPNDNAYGVIFRHFNLSSFYLFMISGDGYYQFNRMLNGTWLLEPHQGWLPILWKKSNAIHTGNATNRIKVSCNGDKFAFYVNDIKVDTYTDTNNSIPFGQIALIAGTGNTPGVVKIDFDNLKVWDISRNGLDESNDKHGTA
jgi:hypothetical protein